MHSGGPREQCVGASDMPNLDLRISQIKFRSYQLFAQLEESLGGVHIDRMRCCLGELTIT